MKKENTYQFTWYTDTGNVFKREKKGKFEKSNKYELSAFMLDNASTFKMVRRKILKPKKTGNFTFFTITK